ncbi:MAG: SurA N-terminal domain-containing protein [Caldimicrobium sp.]|nr:SurA N-terminal domain-containing protein [Caldimicrobium sp.]MCX7612862.1 SurA N-terminal domain-containing protein [Caldimicrobium sp.]MDW8183610.1 SurA N-terminal domain-containing protein [Caldimicrobium sp.]
MFDFLRKGATSIFAKFFLAVIVIVFIFWGIGTFTTSDSETIAEVNGEKISLRDFQEFYNFKHLQLRQTLGDISEEDLKKMKFKESVLDELIQMKIYHQLSKDLKIKITPEELQFAISQIPFFREGGAFDQRRYHTFLREVGLTSKAFEKLLETDLIKQKIYGLLTAPIIVSKGEVEDFYRFQNQRVTLMEFYLTKEACEGLIQYTDKDLENYFLAHRDRYVEEEKLKLTYHFLPFKGEIDISEEDLKRYYQQNFARFREPFKVKLRRILIPGRDENSLKKAQEIKGQLRDLRDFSKFKAEKGEWFEEQALPEEVKSLVKMAKKGDILGPILSSHGYLVLGIEEVQQERFQRFEEVKDKIGKELKETKIKEKIRGVANEYYTQIVKENGLVNWAKKSAQKLEVTPYLAKDDVAKLFQSREIAQKLFKQNKGDYLSPIETEKGMYLVEIVEKTTKRNLTFAEAKNFVKADYLSDRGKALCEERAQDLIKKGRTIEELRILAKGSGFSVREKTLLRKDLPEELINKGAPGIYDQPIIKDGETKIYFLVNIEQDSKPIPENEFQLHRDMLLELKRQDFMDRFLNSYRKKAKIKVYPLFQQI